MSASSPKAYTMCIARSSPIACRTQVPQCLAQVSWHIAQASGHWLLSRHGIVHTVSHLVRLANILIHNGFIYLRWVTLPIVMPAQ